MKKPAFFIVGAPKSGTSALYEYLRQHPDIYMPRKELYFFGRDLSYQHPPPDPDYYHALFKDAGAEQIAGEASVWYLLSKKAAKEIRDYREDGRIIIMLRDPVKMIHSLHFEQLSNGNEDIEELEEALEAEPERAKGKRIPRLIGSPFEALQYRDVGRYSEQVGRYLESFGPERVRIIFFEDFAQDPAQAYKDTLAFLGLEEKGLPRFEQINAPRKIRSKGLRDLLKRRSKGLIGASKLLLPSRKLRQKLLERIEKANQAPTEKPPLQERTRDRLREELRPDVRALGELLGRDLEAYWWRG
jgi:hypothetical protein